MLTGEVVVEVEVKMEMVGRKDVSKSGHGSGAQVTRKQRKS